MRRHSGVFQLLSFLKKRIGLYLITLIISATANASFGILMAFVNRELINAVFSREAADLTRIIILAITAFISICVVFPIFIYLKVNIIHTAVADLKADAFSHAMRLESKYFDRNKRGDIITRLTNDITTISEALNDQLQVIAVSLIGGIGSGVTMLVLDYRLFILTVCLGIASAYINSRFADAFRTINLKIRSLLGELTGVFAENINCVREIKVFNLSEERHRKCAQKAEELKSEQRTLAIKNGQLDSSNYLLGALNLLGVFFVGALMVQQGQSDFGVVTAVVTLQSGLSFMLLNFGNFYAQVQGSMAGVTRVKELFSEDEESFKESNHKNLSSDALVSFKEVSFKYSDGDNVIDKLSFDLYKGQSIAFVGPSGGGKSTIIKLLLGLYKHCDGDIVVEGKNIYDYPLKELRDKVSYVSQDSVLFSGTIEDNIRYGKPNATFKEIQSAAQMANAHQFIMDLPDAYSSDVGEEGNKLSGGQRQRIAIARAMLKGSEIIVFDEATSALDSDSEKEIIATLSTYCANKTLIVVAHRLSTVEKVDKIMFIDNGSVAEEGNHEELLENQKGYYEMIRGRMQHSRSNYQ